MKTRIAFGGKEVGELLEEAQAAGKLRPTANQLFEPELRHDGEEPGLDDEWPSVDEVDQSKLDPGFHLVKDQGVYLMSNAMEAEKVVYATGLSPEESEHQDWSRVMGGDDCVLYVPAEWFHLQRQDGREPKYAHRLVLSVETEGRRLKNYGVPKDRLK